MSSADVDVVLRVLADAIAAVETAEKALIEAHADTKKARDTVADVGGSQPGRTLGPCIDDLNKAVTTIQRTGPVTAAIKREIAAAADRIRGNSGGTASSGGTGGLQPPTTAAALTAPLGPSTAADSEPDRIMIELSSSDPEHVRKLNKPEPNATIIVDGRFRYETDERGRVTKATTTLDVIDLKHPRSKHAQRTLSDKFPGDDAGHLFARIFKGPGQKLNLVPMEALGVNRGEYKSLEAAWRSALEDDREVEVSVELSYDGPTRRPDSIYVTYDDGIEKRSVFIENEPQGGSE
ncbi:DNA/RNA non-specific endonuclease [Nocardioides speluncae]|uniref:DNA/RNA non-specific endonuclease n=1 Tax=Nocardioides speluncae TaxID=2670337 RepID=UPI000D69165B|nr:DNA/RNA non-specific endonuclease [Nocardioides speluncae]